MCEAVGTRTPPASNTSTCTKATSRTEADKLAPTVSYTASSSVSEVPLLVPLLICHYLPLTAPLTKYCLDVYMSTCFLTASVFI